MIIPGDIATLIDFFGFAISIFYCAAMVALIVMRFTKKDEHRPIKVLLADSIKFLSLGFFIVNHFLVNKGAHHHSSYCYGGFDYPGRRTHSRGSTSAILLCPPFHFRWSYFLHTFRIL